MICDKCPALRSEGYEYPEYYCGLGVDEDDTYENKDGYTCCRRKSVDKILLDLKISDKIETEAFCQEAKNLVDFIEKEEAQKALEKEMGK